MYELTRSSNESLNGDVPEVIVKLKSFRKTMNPSQ